MGDNSSYDLPRMLQEANARAGAQEEERIREAILANAVATNAFYAERSIEYSSSSAHSFPHDRHRTVSDPGNAFGSLERGGDHNLV